MGSLFDGVGGFPYAASFYGIKTLWASEILPTAVAVTRRHFPGMAHVGDITRLNGGTLPPVDIITFGSPCQGFSAAGLRGGMSDARSGLFSEAIRIIREMREATNYQYPRFALLENVPGLMSSGRPARSDFKAVLEAFTEAEIPFPQSGKWTNAGMVRGRDIDLSWCVYDAQNFGVPQRRRRIFLIADFIGRRSGEILFIPKSLHRYFAARGQARQAIAAHAQGSSGTAGGDVSPAITMRMRQGCEGGGKGALLQHEKTGALAAGNDQYLFAPVGVDGYNGTLTGEQAATIGVNCGISTGRNGVLSPQMDILNAQGGHRISSEKGGISPTLRSEAHGNLPIIAHAKGNNCLNGWDTQQSRVFTGDGQAPTLAGADGGGGRNPAGLVLCAATCQTNAEILEDRSATIVAGHDHPYIAHPRVSGTLCGSGAGLSRPGGMASETDLYVVSAVDCRNLKECGDISGTLQAKNSPGYSLNYQNPVRISYVVRRLTPVECERLQGYPDNWTAFGHDGTPISDTKRYQMLGNSIAVPCVAYIMAGITEAMAQENNQQNEGGNPHERIQ